MASVYKNGNNIQSRLVEMSVDTRAEIASLPTSYFPGSTCIVIEDSSVWMLGEDEIWHEL